jgi:hypothetical protein
MGMVAFMKRLVDGMNNFDFDPSDFALLVSGIVFATLWIKALSLLWMSNTITGLLE